MYIYEEIAVHDGSHVNGIHISYMNSQIVV